MLERDGTWKTVHIWVKGLYLAAGLLIGGLGIFHGSLYEILVGFATLLLIPGLALGRRLFHLRGGIQMETFTYIFSLLGWTLGGAAGVYGLLPGFDKLVHCFSGIYVSMIGYMIWLLLERDHSREGENPITARAFVFFFSMGIAGLFELCEFSLAPIMQRDLQHVLDTGVGDTMMDIFVCLLGTLIYILLMIRSGKGKHDPFTDAPHGVTMEK